MATNTNTPTDDLMSHFQGRGLKSIVIFTLVAHFVVISVTSIPFLIKKFSGPDQKLSQEERTKLAVKEATRQLRDIAKTYGLQPQQLSNSMRGGRPAQQEPATEQPTTEPGTESSPESPTGGETPETPDDGIRGDSDVENKLREKLPPPSLPPADSTEDLFSQ